MALGGAVQSISDVSLQGPHQRRGLQFDQGVRELECAPVSGWTGGMGNRRVFTGILASSCRDVRGLPQYWYGHTVNTPRWRRYYLLKRRVEEELAHCFRLVVCSHFHAIGAPCSSIKLSLLFKPSFPNATFESLAIWKPAALYTCQTSALQPTGHCKDSKQAEL
jgi:hypothetical protein